MVRKLHAGCRSGNARLNGEYCSFRRYIHCRRFFFLVVGVWRLLKKTASERDRGMAAVAGGPRRRSGGFSFQI
jgi:hypothetical protein